MILDFLFPKSGNPNRAANENKENRNLVTRNISCFITADLKENCKDAGVAGAPPGGTAYYCHDCASSPFSPHSEWRVSLQL